jgi:hypothetical protein
MGQTTYSSSSFWAKQVALAVALIVAAAVLIYVLSLNDDNPVPDSETEKKSVSRGLSEFYRDIRMSATNPAEEESSDFVLDIAGVDPDLDGKLAQMSSQTRPVEKNWTGEHKYRTFKEGNTLREAISQYAQAEGMQLIWNLPQDFVIKHQFQLDNTVAGSLASIASSINSSFEGEVMAYLCAGQRSLVVTAQRSEFLDNECAVVRG